MTLVRVHWMDATSKPVATENVIQFQLELTENILSTDISCCFMTMFDKISREEVTIAAQVSSAEDSRAKTVNERDLRL
jgi:hypothetical protein